MKKLTMPLISILSILAIYNVLIFTLNKNFTQNFWCGYIFITLSILVMLFSFIFANFVNPNVVTGMSIKTLSVSYFVFEAVLGSLLMFFNINFLIVLLPQLIFFLLYVPVYALAISKLLSAGKNEQK